MSDGKVAMAALIAGVAWLGLIAWGADEQRNRLDKYEDTIAEYMLCIKYNPDCECSDIILSEYGEEVE